MILRKKNIVKFTKLLAKWFGDIKAEQDIHERTLNYIKYKQDFLIDHLIALEKYLNIEFKDTKEYRKKK